MRRIRASAVLRVPPVSESKSWQFGTSPAVRSPSRHRSSFSPLCWRDGWLTTTLTGIEAWRLPDPLAVARKGVALLQRPTTWHQIAVTGGEAIAGCALGTVVALPLAYAIYRWRLLAAAVEPFLGATQALPAIAIAPILVLWVGYGITPIVVLCALMVFFPIPRLHGGWPASY